MTGRRVGQKWLSLLMVVVVSGVGCQRARPEGAAPQWTASGHGKWHEFGYVVAAAGDVDGDGLGDVLVIGKSPGKRTGLLYLLAGSRQGLSPQPATVLSIDRGRDFSAAAAGDVNGDGYADVVVGAPDGGAGRYEGEGQAYLHLGGPSGLGTDPAWRFGPGIEAAQFGYAVGSAGDVNGDGFADVIVGAPGYDHHRGRVYLFTGSPAGLSAAPAWVFDGEASLDRLGTSVATAGDINGDGLADVVVGAPAHDGSRGRVYVFYGSPRGPSTSPDKILDGRVRHADFGDVVGTGGDVNGDGLDDLLVTAPRYLEEDFNRGRVFVYHGSRNGLRDEPDWEGKSWERWNSYSRFGLAAGAAGDFNCDGVGDLVIGEASRSDSWPGGDFRGVVAPGKAVIYYGSPAGLGAKPGWTARPDRKETDFGFSVGTAGDVNGDKCADVIIGAPLYPGRDGPAGKVFLYHGAPAATESSGRN